ncbi:MAG TPA: hypothetical protein VLM89_11985 [Phycisphaerae bacterium]|nr:hypothetical protein [Phycisphaerae bacterium]
MVEAHDTPVTSDAGILPIHQFDHQIGKEPVMAAYESIPEAQAQLVEDDRLLYFSGTIVDAPDTERGCRTKITVRVDGDPEALWRNWSHGLHRVTVYGDVVPDLRRFCKFKGIRMVDEARSA